MNKDKLLEYPAFCKSIGVERFSANIVIPAGRGSDDELTVSYSEIGEIVKNIHAQALKLGVKFMWYSPTPICLFNPLAHGFGNRGCSACEGLLSVDPKGNLLPCSSWPEPIGNLLEDGFESVWNSKRCTWIREKEEAPSSCRECRHFTACQGACPLYFDVHGCKELYPAWESMGLVKERSAL
jgi:radical SAM protein with 4Fe4S-binding SPASM domain